jgi:hypothetical protein
MPIRTGDWLVRDHDGQLAHVRSAYRNTEGAVVRADLAFYDLAGTKRGRLSAVAYDGSWRRVKKPAFPVKRLDVLPDGTFLPKQVRQQVHGLKNANGLDADSARAYRMAAEELRDTARIKGLVGDAKGMVLRRANLLELQAEAIEKGLD